MKIIVLFFLINVLIYATPEEDNTSYDRYNMQSSNEILDESKYFNEWIDVPLENKTLYDELTLTTELLDEIKGHIKDKFFIAVVQIESFRLKPYIEKDSEKNMEIKAKVSKLYQGDMSESNYIFYYLSQDIDDNFVLPTSEEKVVFLEKIDNQFYIDPFLELPPQKVILDFLDTNITK